MSGNSEKTSTWVWPPVVVVAAMLIGIAVVLVWYALRQRSRMRLAAAMAATAANGTVTEGPEDSEEYSEVRMRRIHSRVRSASARPAVFGLTEPESINIRQLRQRRWTSRHGNNGITMEELDLVAPVRSYIPGRKRGAGYGDEEEDEDTDEDFRFREDSDTIPSKFEADADGDMSDPESGNPNVHGTDMDATDDTCPVCLEEMMLGSKTRALRCGHEFDARCIEEWTTKANRCPVCNIEPLEPEAMARRRNARSSTRRGIDAAIVQQRRRRARGPNGRYELRGNGGDDDDGEVTDGADGNCGDQSNATRDVEQRNAASEGWSSERQQEGPQREGSSYRIVGSSRPRDVVISISPDGVQTHANVGRSRSAGAVRPRAISQAVTF